MKHMVAVKYLLPLLLGVGLGCLWSCNSGKGDNEPPGPEIIEAVVRIEAPFDLTGYSAAFTYTPVSKVALAAIPIVVDAANPTKGSCTLPALSKSTVLTDIALTHPDKPAYAYPISDGKKLGDGVTVPVYDKQYSVNVNEAGLLEEKVSEIEAFAPGKVVSEFVVFGNMTSDEMSKLGRICDKIKVLMLPDQLELDWLRYSSTLTRVVASKAVSVADACFEGCTALVSLEAPNLTHIGATAFRGTPIQTIASKKLTAVGQEAFAECPELTSIDLSGVKEISIGAFFRCEKLLSVGSLAGAEQIGSGAFANCPQLVLDGKLDKLQMLADFGFENCLKLAMIVAPVLKSVGSRAFYSCPVVTAELPAVESVGREAFAETKIESLRLPKCVESQDGFQDMPQLRTLDLPVIRRFSDANSWGTTALTTLKLNYNGSIEWPASTGRIRLQNPQLCALYLNPVNIPSAGSTFWGGYTWKSISPYSGN